MKATTRPIQFRLFGGPEIRSRGEPVALGDMAHAALAVMAAHGRRGAPINLITKLLWDDGRENAARHRLVVCVSALRSAMDNPEIASCIKGRYLLGMDLVETDLEAFHLHIADQRIEEAAQLVAQGLLPNLRSGPTGDFFDWVKELEARFRGEVREVATAVWEEGSNLADWRLAGRAARALQVLEPDRDEHLEKVMKVLAIDGRPEETKAVFESFRERMQVREPTWTPRASTERILQSIPSLTRSDSDRRFFRRVAGIEAPPLFGRSEEMATLRAVLHAPPEDDVQTVVLTGPPGIGKSRLVEEALRAASLDGHQVLSARCSSVEQRIPLCPLLTAMEPDWIALAVSELSDPWRKVLSRLLGGEDSTEDTGNLPDIDSVAVPRRTCEAFLRLFSLIAVRHSIVLFFDDIQWADQTTLTVLEYIRRRWMSGSLTLLATARAGGEGLRLPEAFRVPGFEGRTCLLHLGPLDDESQDALLETLPTEGLPHEVLGRVGALAGGNPFFLLELIRTAILNAEADAKSRAILPPVLSELVTERCSLLTSSGLELLRFIVCALEPVPPEVLVHAAGRSSPELAAALQDLARFGWLKWSNRGVAVHPELVRLAVLESMSLGQRAFLTRRLLSAFAETGHETGTGHECSQLIRKAYYHFYSQDIDSAVRLGLEAANLSRSTGEFQECIALLKRLASNNDTPHIYEALGDMYLTTGETVSADRAFAEASKRYLKQGCHEEAATAKLGRLRAQYTGKDANLERLLQECEAVRSLADPSGWQAITASAMDLQVRLADAAFDRQSVLDLLERARMLSDAEGTVPAAKVSLLLTQALGVFYDTDSGPAVRAARQAVALANELNEPELQLRSYNTFVVVLITVGKLENAEGRRAMKELSGLAAASGDLFYRTYAKMNVAVWHLDTWRYDEAITLLEGSLQELGSGGPTHARAAVSLNLALACFRAGRREEARVHLNSAQQQFGPGASAAATATMLSLSGLLSMDAGDFKAAQDAVEKLEGMPRPWPFDPTVAMELCALVAWRRGKRQEAIVSLRRVAVELETRMPLHAMFLGDLACGFARRAGRDSEATELTTWVLEVARTLDLDHVERWLVRRYS